MYPHEVYPSLTMSQFGAEKFGRKKIVKVFFLEKKNKSFFFFDQTFFGNNINYCVVA